MILDDSSYVRLQLNSGLKKLGYKDVVYGSSYENSLKKYEEETPDIVLAAIVVTQQESEQAVKNILKKYPKTKVIVMVQGDDGWDLEKAKELGAIGYLNKPVGFKKMQEAIESALS